MLREYPLVGTFSIVARDPRTGDLGVAVATAAPAVGALAPHAAPRLAAIATQSFVNVELGRKAIRLVELGLRIDTALEALLREDPHREWRQVIGIDRHTTFAFTGSKCVEWHGHIIERDFVVAGNMLAGPQVLEAMVETYKASMNMEFPFRLIKALKAGEEAGGDKRGKQSAALLVASENPRWEYNLRVDDHPSPIDELLRIYEKTKQTLSQFEKQYGDLMKIIKL